MSSLQLFIFIAFAAWNVNPGQPPVDATAPGAASSSNPYATIGAIPLPPGFSRIPADNNSYITWLRALPLKKNKTVYTFNGVPKRNQAAQFAVVDISVGDKDLQQCADAVMRLRAEYLYQQHRLDEIDFTDNNYHHYRLPAHADRNTFDHFLEKVFSYCGTASLSNQLSPITDFRKITAGDVLIKGGAPGHAMQVVDIAVNKKGEKIYLLAQSYMPAQDIHVVINPVNTKRNPWYDVNVSTVIETPEWTFYSSNLMKWPAE